MRLVDDLAVGLEWGEPSLDDSEWRDRIDLKLGANAVKIETLQRHLLRDAGLRD